VDTVIVNGAECEPYLSSDHRVMLESGQRVIDGLALAMRALGANRGIIAIEKNKLDAIENLRNLAQGNEHISVCGLKVKYPQGSEKHLIIATTSRQVPSGGLPADAGCVVINASTAAAIADAVWEGKPLYQRVVSVTGCVGEPGNVLARVGTPVGALIDACGGALPQTGRVVSGGPMMGLSLFDMAMPIVKGTSGILALTNEQVAPCEETACIHCGRCAKACAVHLMPMKLREAANRQDWDAAASLHALDCIECGSCSYACPAKIEILSNIRIAKRSLLARMKR
jgi:electron transport complex protein RnfC